MVALYKVENSPQLPFLRLTHYFCICISGGLSDELHSDELSKTTEQSLGSSKYISNDKIVGNLAKEYYHQNSPPNSNPPVITAENQEAYFPNNFDIQREGSIYQPNDPNSDQFYQPSYTYGSTQQPGHGNVSPQAGTGPAATANENMQTNVTLNDLVKSWLNTGGSRKPETIGEEIDELNLFGDFDGKSVLINYFCIAI